MSYWKLLGCSGIWGSHLDLMLPVLYFALKLVSACCAVKTTEEQKHVFMNWVNYGFLSLCEACSFLLSGVEYAY